MLRFTSILFFLIFAVSQLFAQQSRTLFFMHDLPQASYVNPAIQPKCRFFIGIPALNSMYINATSTGISYNDLTKNPQSIDIAGIANQLHSIDYFTGEVHANLITFGAKYKDFYFSFNIAEKIDVKVFYPSRIVDLAVFGNDNLIGRTMTTRGLGANATHLREYSLGIAQEVDELFHWGMRAKLLFGKANITTRSRPFSFTTEDENYSILADWAFQVNSSLPLIVTLDGENNVNGVDLGEINLLNYLLNSSNMGLAVDYGLIYYDDPITYSASILDFGALWWRSDAKEFTNTGAFVFEGLKDEDLTNPDQFLEDVIDSLQNQINVKFAEISYFSSLSPKLNLGATYQFHPKFNAGALFRTEFYPRRPVPSLTLSVNTVNLKNFMGSLSYSVMNGSYSNVGLGLGFGSKNFTFHIISDNVLAFIWPHKAHTANLRFGMNLQFGCKDKKKKFKYSGPGCYVYRKEDSKK